MLARHAAQQAYEKRLAVWEREEEMAIGGATRKRPREPGKVVPVVMRPRVPSLVTPVVMLPPGPRLKLSQLSGG